MQLSKYIDHTLLKADASKSAIEKLCTEAKEYHFQSVCVNPAYVKMCHQLLKDSDVAVCTVIGFPLGQMTSEAKTFEAVNAILNGADEVDMVLNIAALKDGDYAYVTKEIADIKKALGDHILKVIIETCLLTDDEKVAACKCIMEANADFVKTSTGFSSGGATLEDVELLKKTVGDKCKVKASGGIKTQEDMLKMIALGADRIGTSSGVKLMEKAN